MDKIIILGAGISGLTAALHLQKPYEIYEKEAVAGGLCRSIKKDGFIFDYSGHLLHFKDASVLEFLKNITGNKLSCYVRDSAIYSFGQLIPFPFQVNTHKLPLKIIKECVLGFIKAHNSPQKVKLNNFKEWLYATFGEGFTNYFFVPYNNKFWTVPVESLSVDWIEGYIPVPTLEDVIEGALEDSKKVFGYNSQFYYPSSGGIEVLPNSFVKKIKTNLHLSSKVIAINLAQKVVLFDNGVKRHYAKLLSTIPLLELQDIVVDLPQEVKDAFSKLRYMSVFNLNLGVKQLAISDKHWIYFPESNYSFYRIGFPSNFSTNLSPLGTTSMYVEASYDSAWNINKLDLKESVLRDLISFDPRITKEKIVFADIVDIKYGYVLYDHNYNKARKKIVDFLKKQNIYLSGRYGSWKYMSIEDSILDGKKKAIFLNR